MFQLCSGKLFSPNLWAPFGHRPRERYCQVIAIKLGSSTERFKEEASVAGAETYYVMIVLSVVVKAVVPAALDAMTYESLSQS